MARLTLVRAKNGRTYENRHFLANLFARIDSRKSNLFQCHAEGGRNKGGRKQMRANANKRGQTRTNANKRGGENASKRKQTRANVDKRKQTLTPPFIAVFYTPLCNPLTIRARESRAD